MRLLDIDKHFIIVVMSVTFNIFKIGEIMYDDVESFLNNHIGEDATNDLLESLALLDSISCQEHIFPLKNLMGELDYHTSEDSVGLIRSIINDNFRNTLNKMGVEISDQADQRLLYNVLFTLTKIEDYELKYEIKAIIDDGDSSEEILAELIYTMTSVDQTETIDYITDVSTDLIERIDDLCIKNMANKKESLYVDKSVVKANAKRYFAIHPQSHIRELIRQGYSLGEHRDIYITALEKHYFTFDPTAEQYAIDILGLVISTSTTEVLSQAQNLTNTFVPEGDLLIKVNALISKFYSEVFPNEKG